ncbi:MAG: D-alanyl-D-alanine carboxypeptidase/D-alanyl-D-alanine-endopeptidase [Bacteroidales bacterium]
MSRKTLIFLFLCIPLVSLSQEKSFKLFLADSAIRHSEVSFCIIDADSGKVIFDYNPDKSLIPASILKLVTSSAALELLGPEYTFKTSIGYTGSFNRRSGKLTGDIIIKGGGDPALGSTRFDNYYAGFTDRWAAEIKKLGIKKINGRVITDDSYYDYLPVPAKWLWEDAGNYYGAGAYGLSVYDNTYEIHLRTSPDSLRQLITGITPEECRFEFANWLVAAGTADKGYIFAAPYSTNGWLAGSIPVSPDDYVLKASIADPPLIMAKVMDQKLRSSGISVAGKPTTTRLLQSGITGTVTPVADIVSPPLKDIVNALNHESINLYAEHLVKELGKTVRDTGSTEAGVDVIKGFLSGTGINTNGMFLEDGSGLSPLDAVNAKAMAGLLLYMKNKGKHFSEFYSSLPEAGKEGTLKNHFSDPVFLGRMKAKSGSMTRVRSYAGYLTTLSGKDLIFCIIVNNFSGPYQEIISHIEEILKETIQSN